ncbi:MAG: C4-dicarboxylate ABC transporter [Methylococcales bacterium]|nr:C4-dicarboxylate ABC transporter [Methylococcales bacterium]
MARLITLTLVLAAICPAVMAANGMTLNIAAININAWTLQGIHFALSDPSIKPQQLTLSIAQLSLPKPYDDLNLVNIHCPTFTWQNQTLSCPQGRATLRSKRWQSPSANFSLLIGKQHSAFTVSDLHLAGGTLSITANKQDTQWQAKIIAHGVDIALFQKALPLPQIKIKSGRSHFQLTASGWQSTIEKFALKANLLDLTAQSPDGRLATEAVDLSTELSAHNRAGLWQWQSHTAINKGGLYSEPIYLEANGLGLALTAQGSWRSGDNILPIDTFSFQHKGLAVNGSALLDYNEKLKLAAATVSLHSDDLQALSALYLAPIFTQTPLAGISLTGSLNADVSIVQNTLSRLTATINKLAVHDSAGRISLNGGMGTINWADDETFTLPSKFAWQKLQIYALPIGAARLTFLGRASHFNLLEQTQLTFLGGNIVIRQFAWHAKQQQDPDIYFAGSVNKVSLEQVSKALNWTPLSGIISGTIPRIEYHKQTLSLGGDLNIQVFDGNIKLTKLASADLFTDYPKFYSDLEITNLDLQQLTSTFKFGGMTGRLSGFVRQLVLENWHPISFYAWLGTPDDDDSSHRISQKAVKNIASIGGGGAFDILSRSVLSLFETFGYDKLGIGCYLHNGVCQLTGVEAKAEGFAIITGGGLPRISVIGYNPQVDWNVLMERLNRISTSDEAIVK